MSIPLFTVYMVTDGWPLGFFICNFWLQVDYALCYTSLLSIFLICIDRYWSVSNSVSTPTLIIGDKQKMVLVKLNKVRNRNICHQEIKCSPKFILSLVNHSEKLRFLGQHQTDLTGTLTLNLEIGFQNTLAHYLRLQTD